MTYVLIPGAGGGPWTWHLAMAELERRGHDVVVVDLPCDDDSAGLAEYVAVAVAAIGDRSDLVVVAHSLGGFTAPLLCDPVPVDLLVLVAAMVPSPGESPG
nr:alpha/beta hydrolase [Actinomycetota bacterium]